MYRDGRETIYYLARHTPSTALSRRNTASTALLCVTASPLPVATASTILILFDDCDDDDGAIDMVSIDGVESSARADDTDIGALLFACDVDDADVVVVVVVVVVEEDVAAAASSVLPRATASAMCCCVRSALVNGCRKLSLVSFEAHNNEQQNDFVSVPHNNCDARLRRQCRLVHTASDAATSVPSSRASCHRRRRRRRCRSETQWRQPYAREQKKKQGNVV